MFFDTHAHITDDSIYGNLPEILERAKKEGVHRIVNICTDKMTLERGLKLADEQNWVYNSGATTPHDVEKEGEKYFPLFEEAAIAKKLVAIGETGLDYHYEHSSREVQQIFLRRYMKLALSCNLPLVIHCRDAFEDLFSIADSDYRKANGWGPAVLHCFTGTMGEAEDVIKRGWYISFSGIITFKKSQPLRDVAKEMPINHILIETDAPYLAPESKRGKKNEPSFIRETAKKLALIKEMSEEEIGTITSANAFSFFKIKRTG